MAYNIQLVKEKINSILTGINGSNGILKSYGNGIVGVAQGEDVPPIPASKVASGYFPSTRLASADGTDGQILRTDGNGNTYWTDPPTSPGHSDDYNTLTNKPSINSVTLMGNKTLDDLNIAPKGGVVNLLQPTLATTTQNGVTCTNNGDGTYTLNGTATGNCYFQIGFVNYDSSKAYKMLGCPVGGSNITYYAGFDATPWYVDTGSGATITGKSGSIGYTIGVKSGTVCNNLIFKPMITTNLSATYNDFVEYGHYTQLYDGLNHNGIYRGKSLGTINGSNIGSFLSAHEVSTGKFTDLYLGDEIVIQDGTYNATWIIAGFDTEWNKGNTPMITHHVSLIPKTKVTNSVWNSSGTPNGYWGSTIKSTCDEIATALSSVLSSHLLNRVILPSTSISTTGVSMAGAGAIGYAYAWAWRTTQVSLLTEVQVFGSAVCSSSSYDIGEGCNKLPIFNFISPSTDRDWWLRGVGSSDNACFVSGDGYAGRLIFSYELDVRPLICIG